MCPAGGGQPFGINTPHLPTSCASGLLRLPGTTWRVPSGGSAPPTGGRMASVHLYTQVSSLQCFYFQPNILPVFSFKGYEVAALRPEPGVPEGGWCTGSTRRTLTVPASLTPASRSQLCSCAFWPRGHRVKGGQGPPVAAGLDTNTSVFLCPSVTVLPDLSQLCTCPYVSESRVCASVYNKCRLLELPRFRRALARGTGWPTGHHCCPALGVLGLPC